MQLTPEETDRRVAEFIDVCRRAGVKATHQRIEIFKEVAGTEQHPDAETVYDNVRRRIPTVSLDTVYRALALFENLRLVSRIRIVSDRTRFDGNPQPHHHFVCRSCGLIKDFYSNQIDRFEIPDEVRSWGEVNRVHVEVEGLCAACAAATGAGHTEQ